MATDFNDEHAPTASEHRDNEHQQGSSESEKDARNVSRPVIDALDKWGKEIERPLVGLQALRLDESDRLVIAFTSTIVPVSLHFLPYASCRGYVHCLGEKCALCQIGLRDEQRDLLPVYDVIDHAVVVLPVPPSLRPKSATTATAADPPPFDDGARRLLLALRKSADYSHHVQMLEFPSSSDDGATTIKQFEVDFAAGRIDLTSVFARHPNDILVGIDEVSLQLKLRGRQQ